MKKMKIDYSAAVRQFLNDNPALRLTALEREMGIPTRTLQRVKDGRDLPVKHEDKVLDVLKKYGLSL